MSRSFGSIFANSENGLLARLIPNNVIPHMVINLKDWHKPRLTRAHLSAPWTSKNLRNANNAQSGDRNDPRDDGQSSLTEPGLDEECDPSRSPHRGTGPGRDLNQQMQLIQDERSKLIDLNAPWRNCDHRCPACKAPCNASFKCFSHKRCLCAIEPSLKQAYGLTDDVHMLERAALFFAAGPDEGLVFLSSQTLGTLKTGFVLSGSGHMRTLEPKRKTCTYPRVSAG